MKGGRVPRHRFRRPLPEVAFFVRLLPEGWKGLRLGGIEEDLLSDLFPTTGPRFPLSEERRNLANFFREDKRLAFGLVNRG